MQALPTQGFRGQPKPEVALLRIKDRHKAVLVNPNRKSKVALVGYAESTRESAPFEDISYEIWGMNDLYRFIPRADRWFEMHPDYVGTTATGQAHGAWLAECQIPIYMPTVVPAVPSSIRYPLEKIMAWFQQDYYTSTVAYMLALAIFEQFSTIALYGIDLVAQDEYMHQRPCAEFYLGYAKAKGIQLEIPAGSALCYQSGRYGYDQDSTTHGVSLQNCHARHSRLEKELTETKHKALLLEGALMEEKFLLQGLELRRRGATWNPEQS